MHLRPGPPPGNDDTVQPAARSLVLPALDERRERVLTHLDLIDCVQCSD